MDSEKVKEIKKDIDFCTTKIGCEECSFMPIMASTNCRNELLKNCLILINEFESENKELKKYRCDWLNSEKMHLQADMEDTEFELASSNRILEKVNKENQQLKDRIAELGKEHKDYDERFIILRQEN